MRVEDGDGDSFISAGGKEGEKSALRRLTPEAGAAALGAAETRPGTALCPLRLCLGWSEQRF